MPLPTSANHVTVDPSDETKWSFDADDRCVAAGTTLSSYTLTPSGGVTVTHDSSTGNVVTCRFTASQDGSIICRWVFADNQKRERTLTITAKNR